MPTYIGRFAPSPTGPLHFGSLLTAVASYCDAKANQGQWLVRIEDTDYPRNASGAISHIINSLEAFGLIPDAPIRYQMQHTKDYDDTLQLLQNKYLIYGCACSRKQLAGQHIYPKTCTHLQLSLINNAIRLNVKPNTIITFNDPIQGFFTENLNHTVGDFVLKRRDGIYSYQLCVVTDDKLQKITHVVRGADLLDNTSRQIYMQQVLGYATPQYIHLPLAKNANGQKLSKQNLAQALDLSNPATVLKQALTALNQPITRSNNIRDILRHAITYWQLQKIPQHIDQIYI